MSSLRGSPPVVPRPPMVVGGENTPMVDIEQPHKHDVLCGRGVTTNRFPGNESFRSLVSLNKELYVTSTKRQKMSISRSIVEAVRSLKPPGRFLEKSPVTGLWSDIGDRKAIEKTSQALRDGAAGLRKELSEDLGDPDFLSAVFDMDGSKATSKSKPASPTVKDKDKPVKAKPVKKGHRRSRSNPGASSSKAAIKAALKKQKSQADTDPPPSSKPPSRPSSLPPRAPLSPVSPRSHPARPASPSRGGWSMHFPGSQHYPPEEGLHYKSRPYHRSHSYQMTPPPPHYGHPRPPHPPHTWSHAPPRHPGRFSPPNVVHTPQSPLPPGRHQLTPHGCISKPPLSPVVARWSPRHFPPHPYPPPPEYHTGRPDYARSHPGPDFWPPHPDYHRGGHHHHLYRGGGYRDYYHDRYPPAEGLDVPTLGGERDRGHYYRSESPPVEFAPPVTPSRRRHPENVRSSSLSPPPATLSSSSVKVTPDAKNKKSDRTMSDASEGTRSSSVVGVPPRHKANDKNSSSTKDDSTQKTAVMSPMSVPEGDGGDGGTEEEDVTMEDCPSPPMKKDVHIISVVHRMEGDRVDEEGIEFVLKDSSEDEYSLSPLPFEREDPMTLMELPDDILHMPISSCGPHDD